MKDPYSIIDTVCLTEKATLLSETLNKYVFRVQLKATKPEIRQAIETIFKKKVIAVNTCRYDGKKRRERTASAGRTSHWKKAVVTLQAGETIDLA